MFDYDHWAQESWEEIAPGLPFAERAQDIMRHHRDVLAMWRGRWEETTGQSPSGEADYPGNLRFWQLLADSGPLDHAFEWVRRRDGLTRTATLADVLAHLPWHGTYHRGQVRGLCEAHGWEAFPETDVSRWPRNDPSSAANEDDAWLVRRMEYDAWAWQWWSAAWRGQDLDAEFVARCEEILAHSVGAPRRWAEVAAEQWGTEPASPECDLVAAYRWWQETLANAGPDHTFERTRPTGEVLTISVEKVITHLTNHGSYHRGHVRGLAEAANWDDFPDTDYIFFADPARRPG